MSSKYLFRKIIARLQVSKNTIPPRSNCIFVKWGSERFRLFFCLAYLPIFRFFDECMGNDEHFMHDGKQAFIEAGMELYEQDRKTCPFCEQSIRDEAMAWVDRHTQFLDCIYFCFCHQKGNFVLFPLDCFIHGIEKMSLHSGTNSENSAKSSRQKNAKIIAEMQNTKKNSSRT